MLLHSSMRILVTHTISTIVLTTRGNRPASTMQTGVVTFIEGDWPFKPSQLRGCNGYHDVYIPACQLLTLPILVSFKSIEDDHDVSGISILAILSTSLVLDQEVPSCCLLLGEHSSVGDAIFGEVGHPEAMILAWTVHDLIELVLVASFLLVAHVLVLAHVVLLPQAGGPCPC